MKYYELLNTQQKRVDVFLNENAGFAFSQEQLNEVLKKFKGREIVNVGYGCFMLKNKVSDYKKLSSEIEKEKNDYMNSSDNNYKSALFYELGNTEYSYTYDVTDAFDRLDINFEKLSEEMQNKIRTWLKEYKSLNNM